MADDETFETFPLSDVFTKPDEFAAWQHRGRQHLGQRAEAIGERIAAEERAYAAHRRAAGLPPAAPVHPELVPELQREFDAAFAPGMLPDSA